MTFSRDELTTYEKQTPAQVDDKKNPFDGATPAQVADAAAIAAAAASGKTNATPAAKTPANANAATPSGNDDGSDDPSVTGEDGTSDDNADSSTATADPSGESGSTTDESGTDDGEASAGQKAPKKGSAAERIQELLDLTEGYKEFGHLKSQELTEARAELARLRAGSGTGTPTQKTETPQAEVDEPMPDLTDPDVNFDADKHRAKMQKWIKKQVATGTQTAIKEMTGQTAVEQLKAKVEAKLAAAATAYSDWDIVVTKNPILTANQLAPVAARAVAESEHMGAILHKFGKDKNLAIRVAKQNPAEQLISLGRLITQIEAENAVANANSSKDNSQQNSGKDPVAGAKPAKQKSLTQAPPPPKTTSAGGRATERDITDPTLDMDEFARRHREEKQARRTAMRGKRG